MVTLSQLGIVSKRALARTKNGTTGHTEWHCIGALTMTAILTMVAMPTIPYTRHGHRVNGAGSILFPRTNRQ
jgi:hypothetical protein